MATESTQIFVPQPTVLKPFAGLSGPLILGILVGLAGLFSAFDPTDLAPQFSLWWCGAITAQVVVFQPHRRWPAFFLTSFLGILASNQWLMESPQQARVTSLFQGIEPIVGSLIIIWTLNLKSQDGGVRVTPDPKRLLFGSLLSAAWIQVCALGLAASLVHQSSEHLQTLFSHIAANGLLGASTYLPLGLTLSFWMMFDPAPWWPRIATIAALLGTMVFLMNAVAPPFLLLGLLYPMALIQGGIRSAGLFFLLGLMLWSATASMGLAPMVTAPQTLLLMIVATVCLSMGILFLQRELAHQHLGRQAYTDGLTGLLNRTGFLEAIPKQPQRRLSQVSILNVDHFSSINDSMGYQAGNHYLSWLADQIKIHLPPDGVTARLSDDSFAIYSTVHTPAQHKAWALQLQRSISRLQFNLDAGSLRRSMSMGSSIVPCDVPPASGLEAAESGLRHAKLFGKNQVAFVSLDSDSDRPLSRQDIRSGMDRGEFEYWAQQVTDARSQEVIGFEALIRWRRPEGVISPGRFLQPYLQVSRERDYRDQSLALQTRLARALANPNRFFSVNLSIDDLISKEFIDHWIAVWAPFHGQFKALVIEITEAGFELDDLSQPVQGALNKLVEHGFQIALDDFGQERSNLTRLVGWPVSRIKLDKSLVDPIGDDDKASLVLTTLVAMADQLNCEVIAEGVETSIQAEQLLALGIYQHQGFYWSHPKPYSEAA